MLKSSKAARAVRTKYPAAIISKLEIYISFSHLFMLALTVFWVLTFQNVDLKNEHDEGQDYGLMMEFHSKYKKIKSIFSPFFALVFTVA